MEENTYDTMWSDEIRITQETGDLIRDITKWTKFLSILGFIFLGLSVLIILGSVLLISGVNYYEEMRAAYPYTPGTFSWFYVIIYLIVVIIYFFPVYFLYKFSVLAKKAVHTGNTQTLTNAFRFLRNHYTIIGIIAIIMVVFYVIAFAFMFVSVFAHM